MRGMRAIFLLLALSGCAQQPPELQFPSALQGWTLGGTPSQSLEEAWPAARLHGLEALQVADYRGEGAPHVLAHRMATSAGAFETMQQWRQETGTVAFQYGIFFVVVRSPAMDQSGLNRFAAVLKAGFSLKRK